MSNTISVQARVDIISLAQVFQYFEALKYTPQNKSDLIWQAVEVVKNSAIRQGLCMADLSMEEAIAVLERGHINIRSNERSRRMVASALQSEVMADDFSMPLPQETDEDLRQYQMAVEMSKMMGRPFMTFEEFKTQKLKMKGEKK